MNSKRVDYLGWILPLAAAILSLYAATNAVENPATLFAVAIVLLVIADRRRTKTITAALVRIAAPNGTLKGLIGCADGGIQIGVRAGGYDGSLQWMTLWHDAPNVAFT